MYTMNQQILNWMDTMGIDVCFINNPANIAYLTGFSSDPHERVLGLVLMSGKGKSFLFTPAMEIGQARRSVSGLDVFGYLDHENPWEKIGNLISTQISGSQKWAIEKNYLTVERLELIKNNCPIDDDILDFTSVIQEMMLIKSPEEITKMKHAGLFADYAFEVGFNSIESGVSEQEIIAKIEYELKKKGVMEMSFSTLVLAGESASDPHGTPSDRKIVPNEFVLFDLGTVYDGYASDATRMAYYGTPTAEQQKVYDLVLKAHMEALKAIKPGVEAGFLDSIARSIITEAGYGAYFNHRLGHGIGATVHEYPSIMQNSQFIIQEGMCFSIEPGIYLPGEFGIRIEDCVYVTANGCEVLTHTPKQLHVIPIKE
ncbi:dipeptidase [Erysipelotrichaceae bacterium]|nr:dipeptidase [Erysipelotrichaceae bacterium]